jgi:hypothetical protein
MPEIFFNEKLMRVNDKTWIAEFLSKPTLELAEGVTAMLANPSAVTLAAGHIVQAALKGSLFQQLGRELEELTKAGRIKEDYFSTHQQQATLHELLKFIDNSPPDEEVFQDQGHFLLCNRKRCGALEERKAYQFLQESNLDPVRFWSSKRAGRCIKKIRTPSTESRSKKGPCRSTNGSGICPQQ